MRNDYGIIGAGFSSYNYLSLERMPSFIYNSSRVNEVNELINKSETDTDFMESLYRNSNPNYYLGGWLVKAVVDLLLHFTMGDLPTIQSTDSKYAELCNTFWQNNQSRLYNGVKELGLFGQIFMYVGWDNVNKSPKMKVYSKKNVVDIRYENPEDSDDITYIRLRDETTRVKSRTNNVNDDVSYESVYYDKIFWKVADKNGNWQYKKKMLRRAESEREFVTFIKESPIPYDFIPIVEFNQNKLSFDKIGYSDISGATKLISIYHQILESTINNTLYNGQPTLKFTGISSSPIEFVKAMYGDITLSSGDVLSTQGLYNVFGSYYLSQGEDVNWLIVPSTVSDSKAILELLFYLFVQVTGVPEWAFGASITGAWATVKQQAVPLLQKVKAKRLDMTSSLLAMNRIAYAIWKMKDKSIADVENFTSKIIWNEILEDEVDVKMSIIDFMLNKGFITEETAVSLLGMLDNPVAELKKAKRQAKKNQSTLNKDVVSQYMSKVNNLVDEEDEEE